MSRGSLYLSLPSRHRVGRPQLQDWLDLRNVLVPTRDNKSLETAAADDIRSRLVAGLRNLTESELERLEIALEKFSHPKNNQAPVPADQP